jgi:hypothetical protein
MFRIVRRNCTQVEEGHTFYPENVARSKATMEATFICNDHGHFNGPWTYSIVSQDGREIPIIQIFQGNNRIEMARV